MVDFDAEKKSRMRLIRFVIALFMLCVGIIVFTGVKNARTNANHLNPIANLYEYVKDHRTGLCFLKRRGVTDQTVLVPCTPEVERLLVNPSSGAQ